MEARRVSSHHYLTIEQRETLERLICSQYDTGPRLKTALERLREPDYGVCIECGRAIEYVRLQADPAALHCRACARLPVSPES